MISAKSTEEILSRLAKNNYSMLSFLPFDMLTLLLAETCNIGRNLTLPACILAQIEYFQACRKKEFLLRQIQLA